MFAAEESFDRSEFIQYFADEADELLASIDTGLLKLEENGGAGPVDGETVNALFRALHTIKGSAGMLQFGDVERVAHELENVYDLLRTDRMPLTASGLELLFEGRDVVAGLVRAAIDCVAPPLGAGRYLARLRAFAALYESSPESTGDASRFASLSAASPETAQLAPEPGPVRSATIRVDVDRLDVLLNLVGELVINRTRISDIATTLQQECRAGEDRGSGLTALAKELSESSALLARTTNEVQETIMKARMVPIGHVFDRFPRMVRDVAKSRGKDIRLEISGAETDFDKTIVDEVGEPLMHLIRNCIDHGIEAADVREARGKPPHGTIRLNAYHEGNQVIVEVSDDGGGIDLQRVRDKAVTMGVIAEAAKLSERETIELIFTPGFSTANEISDVSGRGVGMDVVKKNLMRLKGVFDVHSVAGEGTTFTMKLPLTLAIIQALLVRVADELYAIPLDAVIESQRIETGDLRTVHGSEAITLRGALVPLVRVGDFFGIDAPRDPDKIMVVIVGVQGRQVGLVVDSFQGEQEIVIKPLSDVLGRIAGISGATILGNGSISLIIDVHALVGGAYAGAGRSRYV